MCGSNRSCKKHSYQDNLNIFCIHIDLNLSTGFTADILTHFKDTDITQARYVSLIGEAVADDLSTFSLNRCLHILELFSKHY